MLQPSEEIKAKLDVVDVIRDYIQLSAAGVNFRAKCPFHHEKTPSFIVSPDKQIWHCFGCGKGGDIFSFVMEMEGVGFAEALRLLAPKAGVILKKSDPALSSQRNRLLDMMDLAARYYQEILAKHQEALEVRRYLTKRGLTEDTLTEWQIGYSLDAWEDLISLLKKRGFNEQEIFLAGLSVRSQERPGFYDRFRGRIMFPIRDINGNIVAFSARVRPDKEATEKMGKYINSPQTMIYDKSRILFGLDKAKQEIKRQNLAIIVEGQMDAVTAQQKGFKNVVASSGTALTTEQVVLLKRYTSNLALAFDMDKAGELAAERGIKEAMAAEMNINIITLPAGKDPDECIRNNPELWVQAVTEAKPMMEYYFSKTFAPLNLNKVEHRREAAKILLPVIVSLGNKIEQDYWLKRLSEKIDVQENLLRETLLNSLKHRSAISQTEDNKADVASVQKSREEILSELILALVFHFPNLFVYTFNHLPTDYIIGEKTRELYKNLLFYYNNIANQTDSDYSNTDGGLEELLSYQNFKSWLNDQVFAYENEGGKDELLKDLDRLALLAEREFYELDIEQGKSEAIMMISSLKKYFLNRRMREIERQIAEAEQKADQKTAKELMAEFKILTDELRTVELT